MVRRLDVYLNKQLVGELFQDDEGKMKFGYSENWLAHPEAMAISCSLPLRKETFSQNECRPFFSGILPEDSQRKLIARNLGISANNDYKMLEKIGGECAGAMTFMPAGEPLSPSAGKSYRALSEKELANILRELPRRPLLAGEKGVRLSLAGVQDKIVVRVDKNEISLPLNESPSTHILKPSHSVYDDIIFNEAFCLNLGRMVGLPTVKAEIKQAEDINYLLIERYDRQITYHDHSQQIHRLHQEDFCQAMGIIAENKYQDEGGPSIQGCIKLLRDFSSIPVIDINRFTDIVIFNCIIGNCDAHGKNFALLYQNQKQLQLAPFFDLICTIHYPEIQKNMAMKLGGEYRSDLISLKNFETMAEETGLAKAAVRNRVVEICSMTKKVLNKMTYKHRIDEELSQLIKNRCEKFL